MRDEMRDWDNGLLETQHGWDARAQAMAEDLEAELAHAQSPRGRLERLERQLAATYNPDGQASYLSSAERVALRTEITARIDALTAEIEAEYAARQAAEWTREVTIARRADWNTRVRSGALSRHGQVWPPAVAEAERAQGWTVDQLRDAVRRHGL